MTTSYFPQDDDWYADWGGDDEVGFYDEQAPRPVPMDLVVLTAVGVVVIFLVLGLGRLAIGRSAVQITAPQLQEQTQPRRQTTPAAPPVDLTTAAAFIMPYTDYVLTQGPHGMSYGHYAIDLASGKGEPILSPINGAVTARFLDGIGNPTLVIANDLYEVTMLHGDYTVQVGQPVKIGDQVGLESNKGNTRDMAGNSCRNRDCGYHTHLNVFDKAAGKNVNPLDLLRRSSS